MSLLKTVNKRESRPASLFFAEMVISLLFFSISGAVILRVFAAADMRSRESLLTEKAAVIAQSFAEIYSVKKDAKTALEQAAGEQCEDMGGGRYTVSFTDGDDALSGVTLYADETRTEFPAGTMLDMTLVFSALEEDGDNGFFTLSCGTYLPGGAGNE